MEYSAEDWECKGHTGEQRVQGNELTAARRAQKEYIGEHAAEAKVRHGQLRSTQLIQHQLCARKVLKRYLCLKSDNVKDPESNIIQCKITLLSKYWGNKYSRDASPTS